MPSSEPCWQSAVTLGSLVRRRKVSPVEIAQAHLGHIAATNGTRQAFLHVLSWTVSP